jgi:hypothetical protein
MKPDATGLECVCGDKERYDAEMKRCECVEGLSRGKDGACGQAERPPESRGDAADAERRGATRSVVSPEGRGLILDKR